MRRLHFAKADAPPKLTMPKWWPLPIALAGLNAAMALAQLGSFEEFTGIIDSYMLVPSEGATTVALTIAALEILSLPVLLRLSLSPAMRIVSSVAVMLVPIIWLQLAGWAGWLLHNGLQLQNSGMFGRFLAQPFGWWVVVETVLFLGLSLFALKVLGGDQLLGRKKG